MNSNVAGLLHLPKFEVSVSENSDVKLPLSGVKVVAGVDPGVDPDVDAGELLVSRQQACRVNTSID